MAKKYTYGSGQKVTASELNGSFDTVQSSESNQALDEGIVGIQKGFGLAQALTPNLTVLSQGPGVARSKVGDRIAIASTQTVDCSKDFQNLPTVPTTDPRIISVFVGFVRFDSSPRIDGNGTPYNFVNDEGFEFHVVRGTEDPSPLPPALDSQRILLGDITLTPGQTQILNGDIDFTRTEWVHKHTQGPVDIQVGTSPNAVSALVTQLGNHLDGGSDRHAAASVDYAEGPDWNDDSGPDTNPAATVQVQLDKLVSDLATEATPSGAERVGSRAQTVGGESVTNGSIHSQVTELLASLDGKLDANPPTMWRDYDLITYNHVSGSAPVFNDDRSLTLPSSSSVEIGFTLTEGSTVSSLEFRHADGATPTGQLRIQAGYSTTEGAVSSVSVVPLHTEVDFPQVTNFTTHSDSTFGPFVSAEDRTFFLVMTNIGVENVVVHRVRILRDGF